MALALTTDGVGTKMLVADKMQDWSTVGIDCVAMNVNDLYVMNMEPVAFVDYIATDKLSVEKMAQIGIGLNEGARRANIDIVGGETASLRGLVTGLDLAGTCLGVQKKDKIIDGSRIQPGDKILGVPSTGVHSNGFLWPVRLLKNMQLTMIGSGMAGHLVRNFSYLPGFTMKALTWHLPAPYMACAISPVEGCSIF